MDGFVSDQITQFTPLEVQLIHYFNLHPNEVISREKLIAEVWRSSGQTTERVVDVAISKLRRKLDRGTGRLITVYGAGYRWLPS